MSAQTLLPVDLVREIANKKGLDPSLVLSIIAQESGGDTYAIRYEAGFKYRFKSDEYAKLSGITIKTEAFLQACSIGLMQIMGCVARENRFEGKLLILTIPEVGIEVGCRQLKKLQDKYKTLTDVIAAYNTGTPLPSAGGYANQKYVTEVLNRMKEWA